MIKQIKIQNCYYTNSSILIKLTKVENFLTKLSERICCNDQGYTVRRARIATESLELWYGSAAASTTCSTFFFQRQKKNLHKRPATILKRWRYDLERL